MCSKILYGFKILILTNYSVNNCHYLFPFQLEFVYCCTNGHICFAMNSKVLEKHKKTDMDKREIKKQ